MPRVPLALRAPVCAALVLLALLADAPAAGAGDAPVQSTILPNGLTVVTRQHAGSEVAAVAVTVRAGGRTETDGLRGGSHFLEHIHFLGTAKYPNVAALSEAIGAVGGDFNARTSIETTTYHVTVPAASLPLAIDVLGEMMLRPTFPIADVERERGVVQEELRGTQRTGLGIAIQTFSDRLLGVAAQDAVGTVDSVGAISVADLLRYREERYTARNMTVAVVSPLSHTQVLPLVSEAFGALPSGNRPPDPALPPVEEGLHLEGYSPFQSVVLVGQRIPGLNSADAAALELLDALLDAPGTRMEDALAKAMVARVGGTRIQQFSDAGIWVGWAAAPPGRAERVAEVVRQQVRRLQDELVPEEELHAAARFLAGQVMLGGERAIGQALRLSTLTALGVYATEEEAAARLLSVTPADIQRVARTYFNPDSFSILAQE